MDSTIVVALIAGVAAILAAVLSRFLRGRENRSAAARSIPGRRSKTAADLRLQPGATPPQQSTVTAHGAVTGETVTIVSGTGNMVTTIVRGVGQREFSRGESDRYKDLGRAKVQLWGERLDRERQWDWDLLGHAIDDYVDAIRRDPENQHPWTNLAYVLYLVGETERAHQCLERSFTLAGPGPNNPGNNYKQVKRAIDSGAYLSGGKLQRPALPPRFWEKHGRLPLQ
jgi:hypothetical protein